MNSGSSRKAEEVFFRLLELDAPAREAELTRLCAEDPPTAREARELLESLGAAESYFEQFLPAEPPLPPSPSGRRAGAYRLVRELGRGGMGVVYLAERDDGEFSRQVAVKFVGFLTAGGDAWKRFESEKRILAGLRHPNIAQLLDAGVSDEGTPYLVMELVDGVPVDEYCRKQNLSVARRIEIFQKVAGAIDFIHRNLVIHRDIKPGNVLVTPDGVPKLLDFGISRVLMKHGEEGSLTLPQNRIATLNYSSPEQLQGGAVSTASDVYSLGLLLYELLAGRPAFPCRECSPLELLRRVVEEDPPSPGIGGELEQIVMKAIRKSASGRYATVREFSADLDCFLAGKPVSAVAPTRMYRLSKWVNRNRLPVAAGAIMASLLLAAGATVTWQMHVARRERAVAERRFGEVRKLARSILFEFHDPISKLAGATEVRRLMVARSREYLDSLARESSEDVGLQLELSSAYIRLGNVQGNPNFSNLGDTAGALESYAKARKILETILAAHPRHRSALLEAGRLYVLIGAQLLHAGQPLRSLELKRVALDHWRQLAQADPDDEKGARGLAAAHSEMATATDEFLSPQERRNHGYQAKAIYEKLLQAHPSDAEKMRDLARVHKYLCGMCLTDADCFLDHAHTAADLDRRRVLTDPRNSIAQLELAQSLGLIATGWGKKGEFLKASSLARESATLRRVLWEADPKDARLRDRLAYALAQVGHFQAKEGRWRQALASLQESIGHAEALVNNSMAYGALDTLGWAHRERADILARSGHGNACEAYQQAAQAYRRLAPQRKAFSEAKLAGLAPNLAACRKAN
ncbi:MAG: serine/threonine protein kinase [Bryobacterales bacterium]|nr:serine/threonine protein kinase [Bryobacterales bacterium]